MPRVLQASIHRIGSKGPGQGQIGDPFALGTIGVLQELSILLDLAGPPSVTGLADLLIGGEGWVHLRQFLADGQASLSEHDGCRIIDLRVCCMDHTHVRFEKIELQASEFHALDKQLFVSSVHRCKRSYQGLGLRELGLQTRNQFRGIDRRCDKVLVFGRQSVLPSLIDRGPELFHRLGSWPVELGIKLFEERVETCVGVP